MSTREQLNTKRLFQKLLKNPNLDAFLADLPIDGRPLHAGWGYRPSGKSAIASSIKADQPLLLLEDAFVRSLKPGGRHTYGLVADSRGIYYDQAGKSDLIVSLNSGQAEGWMREIPKSIASIEILRKRFVEVGASKYNWYPGDFQPSQEEFEPGVLVVDQTRGDVSLPLGIEKARTFDQMIREALDENPDCPVYLRAHPDHKYRGKHSCFSSWVFEEERIRLLPPELSPSKCFKFCHQVYAVTSLLGMEALLHGKTVKSYGWNFYAGWGLTIDRSQDSKPPRDRSVSVERLFEAAYLQYSHFFDPDTGKRCELNRVLDHIELQQQIAKENSGTKITVGWVPWKRSIAEDYFRSPGCRLIHARNNEEALKVQKSFEDSQLLLWGSTECPQESNVPIVRVEDGFLRSVGLGASFHRPLSWICDDLGIYFAPKTPSRLERILETGDFSETQLHDADIILKFLLKERLSKYNLRDDSTEWNKAEAKGKKVILVPGQVELDASIKMGSPVVQTNGDLLRKVRDEEPDAFLIFKSHPDLVAGARHGQLLPSNAESVADLVVSKGDVIDWLELCDEVYTMTSTVGYEALIRGIPVRTYGLPFYAGWGLTNDLLECPRRTRKVTLLELVCATKICYPRYLNPLSGEFTTAIQAANLMASGAIVDNRPWYLRTISVLKRQWVKLNR
ncbi:MAG: capsular polysaccharide biosynthesis protein [Akkermansiaceae bacterium]